jgi:hypothetical protein
LTKSAPCVLQMKLVRSSFQNYQVCDATLCIVNTNVPFLGQLQRKIGLKVLEMGGNAVIGYRFIPLWQKGMLSMWLH